MILVNAFHFSASWLNWFEEKEAKDGDFRLANGQTVTVPMIYQSADGNFQGTDYTAIEIGYKGGQLAMVVVVPDLGKYEAVETRFDRDLMNEVISGLMSGSRFLYMPKWKFHSPSVSLKTVLTEMGMRDAFSSDADFSAMTGVPGMVISNVFHKTYIEVNEYEVEAGAFSGNAFAAMADAQYPTVTPVDRPFMYFIRDIQTNTILFLGRVMNPGS